MADNDMVHVVPQSRLARALMAPLRSASTPPAAFKRHADRIARLVLAEALNTLPMETMDVITPMEVTYSGLKLEPGVCGVSILRAGESMEAPLREWLPDAVIGKILIQRDESTACPKLFYSKLPPAIASQAILLLDPMLATGGSACMAIALLKDAGVPASRIVFCNIVACPEGIKRMRSEHPDVRIVTGAIDDGLDSRSYILPGLGDYGDRYFGTVEM